MCGLPFFGRNSAARSYSPVRAPSVSDVPDRISVVSRMVVGRFLRVACGGGSAVSRFFVRTSKDTVAPASVRRVFWGRSECAVCETRSALFRSGRTERGAVWLDTSVGRADCPSPAGTILREWHHSSEAGAAVFSRLSAPGGHSGCRRVPRNASCPSSARPGFLRGRRCPCTCYIRILRRVPEAGSRRGGSPEAAAQCSSRKKSTIRRQAAPSP